MKEDTENLMFFQYGYAKHVTLKKNIVPHRNLKRCLPDPEMPQPKKVLPNQVTTEVTNILEDVTNYPECSYKPCKSRKTHQEFSVHQITAAEAIPSTSSSSGTTPASLQSFYSPAQQSENSPICGRRKSTLFLLQTKSRFYLGLPKEVYSSVKFVSEVAEIRHLDVLVTLKKIRTNHVYGMLGDDFELSASSVHRIFVRSVPLIASCFKELIFWPDCASIYKTLPLPFQARYNKVQSIIDCFELEIQKPSNPVRQALSWSEYKKCNTLKYLISSTPNGFVNFVSGASGGRTSDKEMVESTGFLEKLQPNTWVMADRGFKHVEEALMQKHCKLVRPPSVPENVILRKNVVRESKRIASLRIHIERVIRRVREFAMLHMHAIIHHDLLHLIDHIVLIVCGIINIQGPLIRE